MSNDTLSFEKAFERLEQILETMNTGKTPLEESLKLFEEAEKLIRTCTGRLNSAEQKIETLIKNRNGEVALDAEQKPRVETYSRGSAHSMQTPAPEAYSRPAAPQPAPVESQGRPPEPYSRSSAPQPAPVESQGRPPEAYSRFSAPQPAPVQSQVRPPAAPASQQMDELPF